MSDSRSLSNRSKQPRPWVKRIGTLLMVGLITAGTLASLDAEAKRMGGGRSVGRQSQSMQQRQATPPAQQPMQQAAPSQAQRAQPGAQPGAAAQPNRSRWLGPIAGLAAGLGIAALLSHFGLGEAFAGMMANFIIIALLAMVGIWLIRKFMNRRRTQEPAYATGGQPAQNRGGLDTGSFSQNQGFQGAGSSYAGEAQRVFGGGAAAAATAAAVAPSVPAGFDTEAFVRNAKVYFVRLQAAWDEGNMADIREFTTPEMFAEVKIDLASRTGANQTDVVQLDAELLGVEDRGGESLASVRFTGLIREAAGASAEPFEEIWNLSKSGSQGWLLAGIQQVSAH
ncbi:Tim44 domain-containing protein [Burkholderia alba]|uniref:Tim44 domain-containing protein n=1 Tax=Burkholderia alba TaxID=2683677 RepID=UPI002B060DA9|nr:TIM44-like domain-containing protein [Burkholderia alba]